MQRLVRSVVVLTAGVALVGLSACSGTAGDSTREASSEKPTERVSGAGLEQFDPCTFFKPDELSSWGLQAQAEEFTPVSFEPGCRWKGGQMGLVLQKNVEETVASYEKNGNWERYDKQSVGGRSGVVANVPGGGATGGCNVLVDAGGGVVIYGVSGRLADSVDACAEAEKIAAATASRLPR
ncbi:Protein of unknown function [Saccharopolyspora kobensis]|uniref:DUF3558 domain-containing protein n=1 Tax=Saccharopolyspora kobensis TaxID=146035 RepID=A0A1H6CX22_9PSEU|nr:DUF3558 domain-containing protein [Saccharopolyspora kobensis]SEG77394.1 Protein of unknown function [Saccharopolyspora kobensis]SFD02266.1 Protein of unknown function [Saccharopolyspora kobensis]